MTTYRLMDGQAGRPGPNGPGLTAYAGPFITGILWKVTTGGLWLNGYWHWVPAGGDTVPRKFALWQLTAGLSVGQRLVAGSTVTSGTMTANSWNFTALPAPIGLSKNVPYAACAGWAATAGFPQTINQFGAGQPYAAGITSGPLFAYSDQGASAPEPFSSNYNQMSFSVAGTDPAVTFPTNSDRSSNFWVDVSVSDVAPAGASFQAFPSQPYPVNYVDDTADPFTLGMEFVLSQACRLRKIWFYSAAGYTQLPTRTGVWDVATQAVVAGIDHPAPVWSGAAGSGWVSDSYTGANLPAGRYKVSVLNAVGSVIWNATTNQYWGAGPGTGGITNGPLTVPDTASATPPGQDTYNQGSGFVYPLTYAAAANGANYWLDAEVVPQGSAGSWWQLDAILKDQAAEAAAWASTPPEACPNDGQPLVAGPRGELFCSFDGYQWPRDGRGPP